MLINLRNALMAGTRWKNPYVTDGLIGMVDGIWNVVGGVHGTQNLRDIVTGYTFNLPSGYTAESDHIAVSTTTGLQITDAKPTEDMSIEYVVSFDDNNTARECALEDKNNNLSFRFKKVSGYLQASFVGSYVRLPFSAGTVASFSVAYGANNSPKLCGYENGSLLGSLNFAHTMSGRYGGGFRIGRTGYTAYQKIYCVRIYNRALTAQEIAANYAIDKARFGLP